MSKKIFLALASAGLLATGIAAGAAYKVAPPDCSLAINKSLPACARTNTSGG